MDTTGPGVDTNSAPSGPSYIVTIDQLLSLQQVILNQEATDSANLRAIFITPTESMFQTQLTTWATLNFPTFYPIASISLNPPAVCSDGVSRNYIEYALFCLQAESFDSLITQLQPQFLGISLSYTYSDPMTINLVVSKA
jgi:hypothetical protein